jgi:hypothetical protein
MRTRQLLHASLILLAAIVLPAWIGYGLGRGTINPDQTVLAALAIAGCAGYALGRGVSFQP